MSVTLKRQRDKQLRPFWYGEYVDNNGKRKIENLGKWEGTPPPSLLGTGDQTTGSPEFEQSRRDAEKKLAAHAEDAKRKGRAEHLTERLIESKTGRAIEYTRLADLPKLWRVVGRDASCTDRHFKTCDARFARFIEFIKRRHSSAVYLYEVTPADAAAFVADIRGKLARSTASATVRLINASFNRFLPVGSANPFKDFIGQRGKQNLEAIHRRPLSPDELKILFSKRDDAFMYPLVVAAACSGMRRGDVCSLKWRDVDLAGGMLTVKTSKTGETVEIPIFPPLRAVLESQKGNASPFVFPEAELFLNGKKNPNYKEADYKGKTAKEKRRAQYLILPNPQGLSYRFKVFLTRALNTKALGTKLPRALPAASIEREGADAILETMQDGERRDRTLDTFRRYCAGESMRTICKETQRPKGTISYDLHTVEDLIGKNFIRSEQARGVKADIATMTRSARKHGQRAASILDWHAMRTTWVTLALTNGVSMDFVRKVTGHATADIVEKHYFRPSKEQFKAALADSMPSVLTGGHRRLKAADEMGELIEKLKAGTAKAEDKKRLKELTAKL
jgi:integrase